MLYTGGRNSKDTVSIHGLADDPDETRSVRSNARSLNIQLNSVGHVRRKEPEIRAISKPSQAILRENCNNSRTSRNRPNPTHHSITLRKEGLEAFKN